MPRLRSLFVPLATALLLAGCGGGASDRPDAPTGGAPAMGAGLRVGATDLRLGDASVGSDRSALRELRVGRRRVDPDTLKRRAQDRAGVAAGASCANQDVLPAAGNTATIVASTLCLLNAERAAAGLGPLAQDGELAEAAVAHSEDMVDNQYFAHEAPDGSDVVDRLRASGYIPTDRAWLVGENLAWGTGTLSSPRNIVAAWMNSQGHRENILRSGFNEIGFERDRGQPALARRCRRDLHDDVRLARRRRRRRSRAGGRLHAVDDHGHDACLHHHHAGHHAPRRHPDRGAAQGGRKAQSGRDEAAGGSAPQGPRGEGPPGPGRPRQGPPRLTERSARRAFEPRLSCSCLHSRA